MGYKSDVRIITTKKGYEVLKKYTDEYLQIKEKKQDNLLNDCSVYNETKALKYFGWDDIKWYEDDRSVVSAIMEGLNHLKNNDFSYRYSRYGEDYDDYDELSHESYKKEKIGLPYISLKRSFDDDCVLNGMKVNEKINKEYER